ncbi:MAG: GNAT family N-acetyltransferase [Hyphomicrobiales bacterium]
MKPDKTQIHFKPLAKEAFPMLRAWLSEPNVREWWGEPEHELRLMEYFLTSDTDHGFIAHLGEEPIGYIQNWTPRDYIDDEPWAHDLPQHTIAIDVFMGPNQAGKGLGPKVISAFCAKLFDEGATYLVIDPDAKNSRAISAYSKAGFKPLREYRIDDGITYLMDLTKIRFQRTS